MAIKVFVSSISGNKEVKRQQQHVLFVLSGHNVNFIEIDIADPSNEELKQKMLETSKANAKGLILPPQVYNEDDYCGDHDDFERAIESEQLFQFLKLAPPKDDSDVQEIVHDESTIVDEREDGEHAREKNEEDDENLNLDEAQKEDELVEEANERDEAVEEDENAEVEGEEILADEVNDKGDDLEREVEN